MEETYSATGRISTFSFLGFAKSFTIHQFAFQLTNFIAITSFLLLSLSLCVCDLKIIFFVFFSSVPGGNEYGACVQFHFTHNLYLYFFC